MSATGLLLPMIAERLQEAARQLAARDQDHAVEMNGVGFNGTDTWFGHGLATLPLDAWTRELTIHAWRVLRKYRTQLSRYGVEFDEIPQPPGEWDDKVKAAARTVVWNLATSARVKSWARVDDDGTIVVAFARRPSDAMLDGFKQVPGRKKWMPQEREWHVTGDALTRAGLVAWVAEWDVEVFGDLEATPEEIEEARERIAAEKAKSPRRVEIDETKAGRVLVFFPKNDALKDELRRRCPSARWDGVRVCWTVGTVDSERLGEWAKRHGFAAPMAVHQLLDTATELRARARDASAAVDADLDLDGFGVEPFPFQRAGIAYALNARRTFIADEMGLGKTIQALGTLHALGDEAFPALVVCPSNVLKKWPREILRALPGRRVSFLESKPRRAQPVRTYDRDIALVPVNDYRADVFVVNYDKLPRWIEKIPVRDPATGEQLRDGKGRPVWEKQGSAFRFRPVLGMPVSELVARGLSSIVLDESHYIVNHRAQRTAALKHLVQSCDTRLALTGTSVLNGADDLIAQLGLLDRLRDFGGLQEFRRRFVFGAEHKLLHDRLREVCYVRRMKADVMPELPAKLRDTVELPITNRAEYERADAETLAWLREQAFDAAMAAGLDEEEAANASVGRLTAALRAQALVRMNALRRLAAEGLVDSAVEWIVDFLETTGDEKIVVWAYHRDMQEAMAARLASWGVVTIGAEGDKDAATHRFQTEPSVRVAVCSLAAAREGIELTAASNAAFVELWWRPGVHDQAEDRCYGRLDDPHGMNVYYLLAEDTIYGDMAELIDAKRELIDEIQDGREGASGGSILGDVVARMLNRQEAML